MAQYYYYYNIQLVHMFMHLRSINIIISLLVNNLDVIVFQSSLL
jgi:hypothetical protein